MEESLLILVRYSLLQGLGRNIIGMPGGTMN